MKKLFIKQIGSRSRRDQRRLALSKRSESNGFGLIEVLISVAIISMFLGGLLAVTASGTKLTISSERRVQAANLARDGMEKVRALRETVWLKDAQEESDCYKLNKPERKVLVESNPNCPLPYALDNANEDDYESINKDQESDGLISIGDLDQTSYARIILIEEIDGGTIRRVTVEVKWKEGTKTKDITAISYLTKWRE